MNLTQQTLVKSINSFPGNLKCRSCRLLLTENSQFRLFPTIMCSQIAILVDTNVEEIDVNQLSQVSNSICLSAFRLLHFLAAKFEKKGFDKTSKQSHTAVRWGYKFFSSKAYVTRIEQHRLKDFKLKYFEEFENEVQRRLENKPQCLETSNQKNRPCDCLSKALTELLSDFPWERPDITSPVRGRKKKKESNTATNVVILFTRCPKRGQEFKLFTGKKVPDSEVFLDSLLPPALYHQFCNVSQLSLNWIDTEELYSQNLESTELKSVNIVQEALGKARGKLLPLSSLVHLGTPFFSNLAALGIVVDEGNESLRTTGNKSAFLLPFTASFDHLFTRHKELHLDCAKKVAHQAVLHMSETQTCNLSLSHLVSADRQSKVVAEKKKIMPDCDLETVVSSKNLLSSEKKFCELVAEPTFQPYSVLMRKNSLLFEKGETFICSETIFETEGSSSTSGLLERVIDQLRKRNLCLVLLCSETQQLAVMEPLTSHTASLWMVPIGRQLQLEKELFSQTSSTASTDRVETQLGCDNLIQKLVSSGNYKKSHGHTEPQKDTSISNFDATFMDRWHISGSSQSKTLSGLIDKLNERINELDFLTESEASALRQLQKAYRQENRPPGLRDTSVVNMNDSTQLNTTLDELSKVDSNKTGKKTNRQSVSRGEFICNLSKTKDDGKEKKQSEKEAVCGKKEKEKPDLAAQLCDFGSAEELKDYLTSMYQKVITGEVAGVDTNVQTMVTVVHHYMKQNQPENPEENTRVMLEECVMESGAQLREKYSRKPGETDKEEKMVEYQLQILLRLEILSTLINKDQTLGEEDSNDEIIGLLRTLSFISEPGFLAKFMETKILYNYVHTIPKTLANIYDELMHPLPDLLANQLSPNTSGDHSDLNTSLIGQTETDGPPSAHTRSHDSVGPPSSQPGSNRSVGMDMISTAQRASKKLIHHPSLANFGPKRQIVVQKIPKAKEKSSKKRRRKPSGKSERDKISKRLFDGNRGGTKLERRQSVAVMERTHKTPKKSRLKHSMKSPRRGFMSPRRKIVAETPCHKQVSQVLRLKESDKEHHSSMPGDAEEVIEESPQKQVQDVSYQDTPTKAKRAKALLRRSFYSAEPVKRTRNLTKYFQLADKIAGRQRHTSGNNTQPKLPKLISREDPSAIKSPTRNSSFLLSQLISSPSPAKRTPRKTIFSPVSGKRTPRKLALPSPTHARQSPRSLTLLSPSSAQKSKTPRKLNVTPFELDKESPSAHTRSKSGDTFVIPSSNILMSPVSRRQSPRVLAADSNTKMDKTSPEKTPMKSSPVKNPVCGTISAGLDSPSQNTRIRPATTPTRKSVRAALFAKSPVIKNCSSSIKRGEISNLQSKLMSSYSSPKKAVAGKIVSASPRRQAIMSPSKRQRDEIKYSKSHEQSLSCVGATMHETIDSDDVKGKYVKLVDYKDQKIGDVENNAFEKCSPFNFGLTPNSKRGPTIIQRTPSPNKKPKTKTPDSFDKWHRRKPRSSQSSPAVRKQSVDKCSASFISNLDANFPKSVTEKVGTSDLELSNTEPLRPCSSQNKDLSIRRKRSLMPSPNNSYESPSKRQRLNRLRSSIMDSDAAGKVLGSQGFDITGSLSEFSQTSAVSSVDYFSASNDEVFLSQDVPLSQEDVEMENIENNHSGSIDLGILSQPSKGWFSPRHKTLERLTSSEFSPSGKQDQRSDSPVFGSSKKAKCNRNISGGNTELNSGLECADEGTGINKDSPSARKSPEFGKSPGNKKYSPNVSAKSLMHLIQSPLLNSPQTRNIHNSSSPRNCKTIGDRSRRSLKMLN